MPSKPAFKGFGKPGQTEKITVPLGSPILAFEMVELSAIFEVLYHQIMVTDFVVMNKGILEQAQADGANEETLKEIAEANINREQAVYSAYRKVWLMLKGFINHSQEAIEFHQERNIEIKREIPNYFNNNAPKQAGTIL